MYSLAPQGQLTIINISPLGCSVCSTGFVVPSSVFHFADQDKVSQSRQEEVGGRGVSVTSPADG